MSWTREEWARKALDNSVGRVMSAAAGQRDDTLLAAACSVAPYVAGGWLAEAEMRAALTAAAASVGHTDRVGRTITSGLQRAGTEPPWWPSDGASLTTTQIRWAGRWMRAAHRVGLPLSVGEIAQAVDLSKIEMPTAVLGGAAVLRATMYPSTTSTQGQEAPARSWHEWVRELAEPMAWPPSGKAGLPLWAPHQLEGWSRARVPDGVIELTGHEAHRAPHVEAVHALMLDYDDDPAFSMDAVARWWDGVQWMAHTSASHEISKGDKPAHGRGRVVVALSRSISEEEHDTLVEWVAQQQETRGRMGVQELRNCRRAYYVPSTAPGGYAFAASLCGRGLDVDELLRRIRGAGDDLDDALHEQGPDPDVWAQLTRSTGSSGVESASACLTNVLTVLREDRRWKGRIAYDSFTDALLFDEAAMVDHHAVQLREELERVYGMRVGRDMATDAIALVSRENERHELRDWLDALQWDGTPRIDRMLRKYFQCRPINVTSDHYHARAALIDAYSRCFLLAMVARAYRPGCKHDAVLIIRGSQGVGKSTGLRALVGSRWFGDSNLPIGEEEAYRRIQGCWLWELAELQGLRKREAEELKSFLASQHDTYRQPYARLKVTRPRVACFAGTTNADAFLDDPTGHRRFWVVAAAGAVDVDGLRADRDQLWAEAATRFHAGEPWALPATLWRESEAVAQEHESDHPWRSIVEEWLLGRGPVTVTDVLVDGLKLDPSRLRKGDAMVIAGILRQAGRVKERQTRGGRRTIWWVQP